MQRVTATAFALVAGIALLGAENASLKITGRVLDYKSRTYKPIGVPGVIVEAFNTENKLICEALTNGEGEYILECPELDQEITIQHRKIGYLRDPEVWKGGARTAGVTIYMAKRNADQAYYKEVGEAIADRSLTIDPSLQCSPSTQSYGGGCPSPEMIAASAVESEWRAFVQLGVTSEQKEIARRAVVASQLDGWFGEDWGIEEDLLAVEVIVTASQIASMSPEAATEVVRSEGFLPDVYFDFDSVALSKDTMERLQATVLFFRTSEFDLVVEGHADEQGTNEYNMALSSLRASAVRDYLVRMGLDESRINTISHGEELPTCSELSEACYSQNRRAHLRLRAKALQ